MILINGEARTSIDVTDRGLQYGDGLFETIAIVDGRAPLWERHMQRLAQGCERLQIAMPDAAVLAEEAAHLSRAVRRAVLKVIVTRGGGGRGYRAPQSSQPTRALSLNPWPTYAPSYVAPGIALRVCETRMASNPRLAGIKHLNRLEQVLARSEWRDEQIAEGLMLDLDDGVIEGTMTNLFAVIDDRLVTPSVARAGVAGVARALVLELAPALGLETRVARLTLADLRDAQELFVTNSLIGLWPVARLEAQAYAGAQGFRTAQLRAALRDAGLPC